MVSINPIFAISLGASLGALLRWCFSQNFNPVFATLPLGTLASNLVGGYLVGLSVSWLGAHPEFPPEARLLIVTGFLGGLTTFSTYSAEVVTLMTNGRYASALGVALVHLVGSFALTALGMATYRWIAH
jgi:CrcB protein